MELTPNIDPNSNEAIYFQLYQYIRDEISTGRIKGNQKIPSIRKLSNYLRISRTPVSLAYEQLLAEGYIYSKPRSGYFTVKMEQAEHNETALAKISSFKREKSLSHFYHAVEGDSSFIDFGYGSIDLDHFPLTKWRKLMNRCLLPENSHHLLYGNLQGEYGLRKEIASYLYQFRGVRCSPDQIVVGAGTYHSLDFLFQIMKDEMTSIAIEQSVNIGVKSLLKQSHFSYQPLDLESDGICIEQLTNKEVQAVYVTPSHQFPFGMTLSVNKRLELLNWAKENDAYIIENDYDSEFRYSGRPIPSLQSLDHFEKVIYLGTFSKSLTPSFRISILVLPPSLMKKFMNNHQSYDQLASPIFQKTLQWFMESGDFERHMRKMRSIYQKKHHVLLQEITKVFPNKVKVIGEGAGLHIVLEVHNHMNENELIQAAKQKGVNVYPISIYNMFQNEENNHRVLIGFGGLTEDRIVEGIRLLKEAWF